jgi:hypothetical protein
VDLRRLHGALAGSWHAAGGRAGKHAGAAAVELGVVMGRRALVVVAVMRHRVGRLRHAGHVHRHRGLPRGERRDQGDRSEPGPDAPTVGEHGL